MKQIKKFIGLFLTFLVLSTGYILAQEEQNKDCLIEGWRSYSNYGFLTIEGAITCKSGHIFIRIYQSGEYIGNATGSIEQYTFEAMAENLDIGDEPIEIKYGVEKY